MVIKTTKCPASPYRKMTLSSSDYKQKKSSEVSQAHSVVNDFHQCLQIHFCINVARDKSVANIKQTVRDLSLLKIKKQTKNETLPHSMDGRTCLNRIRMRGHITKIKTQ